MHRILAFFSYSLSFLAIPFTVAVFVGLGAWAALLVHGTGLKISPLITGGEVARTVNHGAYETRIYHPVFAGLFAPSDEGFVQIDWPKQGAVPLQIDETVDLAGDGTPDFRVQWNTRTNAITLTPLAPAVLGLRTHDVLDRRYLIRVNLRRAGA